MPVLGCTSLTAFKNISLFQYSIYETAVPYTFSDYQCMGGYLQNL
jgi:hypothetical protein